VKADAFSVVVVKNIERHGRAPLSARPVQTSSCPSATCRLGERDEFVRQVQTWAGRDSRGSQWSASARRQCRTDPRFHSKIRQRAALRWPATLLRLLAAHAGTHPPRRRRGLSRARVVQRLVRRQRLDNGRPEFVYGRRTSPGTHDRAAVARSSPGVHPRVGSRFLRWCGADLYSRRRGPVIATSRRGDVGPAF
jgi:hypothetical protein